MTSEQQPLIFELLRLCDQHLESRYRSFHRRDGQPVPTMPQLAVLRALSKSDCQRSEIGDIIGAGRSTIAELINRMIADDMIATCIVDMKNGKPGRNPKSLKITPQGRRALKRAMINMTIAEHAILMPLTTVDRDRFRKMLSIVASD